MTAIRHLLVGRRYGSLTWDAVLWTSGLLALAAIPVALWMPSAGGMVGFALVTIWVNGPLSPFLPSTYEPILMLFGRVYTPWMVAAVGVAGTVYVEYLNYHLYRRALQWTALKRMRDSAVVQWVLRRFERAPFFTVWLCSWSPLPYWPVRFVSPMAHYSPRRHLTATFLGRFPRLWFFAALGVWWQIPMSILVAVTVGSISLGFFVWFMRGRSAPALVSVAPVEAGDAP